MSSVIINIIIGLVTSVISGISVWLWEHARRARIIRNKEKFFSVERNSACLIVMPNRWDKLGATSHFDVQAMIEIASLASGCGASVRIESCNDFREINGNRTEFCIGGPKSNPRTSGHIAVSLPGVTLRSPDPDGQHPSTIVVGSEEFPRNRGKEEYALVAKFIPRSSSRPVLLIAGQSSITNIAAIKFLQRDYQKLSKLLPSIQQFCIIVKLSSIEIYGFGASELARDVSEAAFRIPERGVDRAGARASDSENVPSGQ